MVYYPSNQKRICKSFCEKAPILISFNANDDNVVVKLKEGKEKLFSYTDNVHTTIFEIKKWLVNYHYPRLIRNEVKEYKLSSKEIAEKLEKDNTLDVNILLSETTKVIETKEYIIIRFLEATQEVFLLDVNKKVVKKFKMGFLKEKIRENIPPMTYQEFLRKYEKGKEEIMGDLFFEKSVYVFDVYNNVSKTKIDDFSWVKKTA